MSSDLVTQKEMELETALRAAKEKKARLQAELHQMADQEIAPSKFDAAWERWIAANREVNSLLNKRARNRRSMRAQGQVQLEQAVIAAAIEVAEHNSCECSNCVRLVEAVNALEEARNG